MRFKSWLRELRQSNSRMSRRRRSRFAGAPEALEQRTLLSTFIVNSTADTVDANPGDGIAADADGNTTLRAAVMESNAVAGGDKIVLPAGTYTLQLTSERDIDVSRRTTIVGAGAATTIIDANQIGGAFRVHETAVFNLSRVTLTGSADSEVGLDTRWPIWNTGGTITMNESYITGNHSGGVRNYRGTMTVTNSTISNNIGGGILNGDGATLTVVNTTISGNFNSVQGAGINNFGGAVTVLHSTITGNRTVQGFAGIHNVESRGGTVTIGHSIVYDNDRIENDAQNMSLYAGSFTSLGYNIYPLYTSSDSVPLSPDDLVNVDPLLGPLADNGGPVPTHRLLAGSPAVDAGVNTADPTTDARGMSRIADGDADGTATIDVGAFEVSESERPVYLVLPGGGPYDVRRDGADLVVRRRGAKELFREDFAATANGLVVRGSDGDDTLVVDYGGGDPVPVFGLTFDAGHTPGGVDRLRINDGSAAAVHHRLTDQHTGRIDTDADDTIAYRGIHSVTDRFAAGERSFRYAAGYYGITLRGGVDAGDGMSRLINDGLGTRIDFVNPADTLLVRGGDRNAITATSIDHTFAAALELRTVEFLSGILDARGLSVDVTLRYGKEQYGGSGNDLFINGRERMDGGAGNDTFFGGEGNDWIIGGDGVDLIVEDYRDRGHAEELDLTLTDTALTDGRVGFPFDDTLSGIERADITAADGDNLIDASAFSGRVTLYGSRGDDTLIGTDRGDSLYGGAGADQLFGNGGNDQLRGHGGDDLLSGGDGRDKLHGGGGHDSLTGGEGNDTLWGHNGNDGLAGGAGNDRLLGDDGDDTLLGGTGDDTLRGRNGDDVALGEAGTDDVNGNGGNDTVAGGGNGNAAESGETPVGETINDEFVFDAPWVNI